MSEQTLRLEKVKDAVEWREFVKRKRSILPLTPVIQSLGVLRFMNTKQNGDYRQFR